MNPPVDAPASRQSRSRGIDREPIERRAELLSPARDEPPGRPDHLHRGVGRPRARRPSWPGSRRRSPVPAATAACASARLLASPRRTSSTSSRRRGTRRSLGCGGRRRLRGGLLRGGLLRRGLLGRRLLPDARPDAVMPARRSRSRTRFFTASRSACVATPIDFIWEATSREMTPSGARGSAATTSSMSAAIFDTCSFAVPGSDRLFASSWAFAGVRLPITASIVLRTSSSVVIGIFLRSRAGCAASIPAGPRGALRAPAARTSAERSSADERRHDRDPATSLALRDAGEDEERVPPQAGRAAMSVSSRSPITSGVPPPARSSAASMMGASGLPNTSARAPVVVSMAASSAPAPGQFPSAAG